MIRGEIFCPDTLESNQFYVIFPDWVNWNFRNMLSWLALREYASRVATSTTLQENAHAKAQKRNGNEEKIWKKYGTLIRANYH
jgi:hypothetical protein